ncbi:MAG: hypothetical protein FJ271_32415 [Planctomycetes bacterium]|nr:hypothetical protein [Planctomycetota bacterium]
MTSGTHQTDNAREWALASPWLWIALSFVLIALAVILRLLDRVWQVEWALLFPGFLAGATGVWIGLSRRGPDSSLEGLLPARRALLLLGLAMLFGGVFLALTACTILSIAGNSRIPWKPGSLVVVWIIAAPASAAAFRIAWRNLSGGQVRRAEETAALLASAGLLCVLACWAIEWDTIQLLIGSLAFVAFVASPLMLVTQPVRRAIVSIIVLIHFGGIITAVLATPPMPWISGQLWTRIYRPYLEFMYLVNAYHYYSPEPGPASYLWFRLIYLDENGDKHGEWYKVPEFDERERPKTSTSLEYNRLLALTENISHANPVSTSFDVVPDGKGKTKMVLSSAFEQRLKYSPSFEPAIGKQGPPAGSLLIPFHPLVAQPQQYMVPGQPVKELISSYAKHATRRRHSEHPEWQIHSAKIYKVKHIITQEGPFMKGYDPREPYFYLPYYFGQYDPDGKLLDPNSPFLYWLVPILEDGHKRNYDYARRHADDPRWVRDPVTKEWIEWPDPN